MKYLSVKQWLPVLAATLLSTTSFAFEYDLIDLGSINGDSHTRATSVNNLGQVTGCAGSQSSCTDAYLWEQGVRTDLGNLLDVRPRRTRPFQINNQSHITGSSTAVRIEPELADSTVSHHVFFWQNGVMTDLETRDTQPRQGEYTSIGLGINDIGLIVGTTEFSDPLGVSSTASGFILDNGVFTELSGFPSAVNNYNQITGIDLYIVDAFEPSVGSASGWSMLNGVKTTLSAIFGLPGEYTTDDYSVRIESRPYGVNDQGQIVGSSSASPYSSTLSPTLWENHLPIAIATGEGRAVDINNLGQVVGLIGYPGYTTDGFIYDSAQSVRMLTDLIAPDLVSALGVRVTTGSEINDNGWVVGNAEIDGNTRGVLLVPAGQFGSAADLALTITSSASTVNEGDAVDFTVDVTNIDSAGAVARLSQMTLSLPASATILSANSSVGSCAYGNNVLCSLGDMAVGEHAIITVSVQMNTATDAPVTIRAMANSGLVGDGNFYNNKATTELTVLPIVVDYYADLGIDQMTYFGKTADVDSNALRVGDSIWVEIIYTNHGPDAATTRIVSGELPENISFTAGSSCSIVANSFSCQYGGFLLPNASSRAYLEGIVESKPALNVMLTAKIESDEIDSNISNNMASMTLTMDDFNADLSIAMTAYGQSSKVDTNSLRVGNVINVEIAYSNAGPDAATNAIVSGVLPENISFSGSHDACMLSITANSFSCQFSTLPTSSGIIYLEGMVKSKSDTSTFTLTSEIGADELDRDSSNNMSSAILGFKGVSKSGGGKPPRK